MRTKYVMPEYPTIARANAIQGVVIIEAVIGTEGKVDQARVLRSHPMLEHAALTAVKQWEYTPTLLNDRPTPVIMTVTVQFTLK
jgi:TonB family protein